ncbi:dTDP-4-dehydrorhamnose 3,5-epimerase family protein [Saccharomonospora xinjiangensis]|nr:dTDP-4-dehydrorhamnose 3,5-epimerase [Saccharomonospora xinjiangensis]
MIMKISPTQIPGAFQITPEKLYDNRGYFYEAVRTEILSEAVGAPFSVAQVNFSVSAKNTLRGIHGTTLPPGQAKLVSCVRGAVLDIAVDLRVGSPTFGHHAVTYQDADSGVAVYLAEGLGHGFLALTDDTCMNYLCSEVYVPGTMIDVDALDPALALPWNLTEPPIRSAKDAAAPTLAEAEARGLLPRYEDCIALYSPVSEPR